MNNTIPVVGILLATALPAFGQSWVPSSAEVAEATFLNGWQQPDGSWMTAVEITLIDDWHTYWRVPGEAGVVASFDWSGSKNLAAVSVEWPHPEIFRSYGTLTFGYKHKLVLPIQLTPKNPNAPIGVDFEMAYGVCEQICMLAKSDFQATLTAGSLPEDKNRIKNALAKRTRTAAESGVTDATCAFAPDGKSIALETAVTFSQAQAPGQYTVVENGNPKLWISLPQSRTSGRQVVARSRIDGLRGGGTIDRSAMTITILDAARSVQVDGCSGKG